MDKASNDPRHPNGTTAAAAATTNTPVSDAVANILAASPDWRMQAGPSPAAGQAADAGQFGGQAASQAAAGTHDQAASQAAAETHDQAADAGQFVGQAVAPAAPAGHQGQIISSPSQIGDFQSGIAHPAVTTTGIAAVAATTTIATGSNQAQAATANQSRSRTRSYDTTDGLLPTQHAHPSPSTASATGTAAGPSTPIPRIVITTPDHRIHAPDSPTLHRARQPSHRRLRRQELQNRIASLEQRIREMTDEAEAQEMVTEALWRENAQLRGLIREWEAVGERRVGEIERLALRVVYLEGEVGRERGVREGWMGRAGVAEGVLGMLGWGGVDGEVGGFGGFGGVGGWGAEGGDEEWGAGDREVRGWVAGEGVGGGWVSDESDVEEGDGELFMDCE
ncbi:hypothetical protein VE02_00426 [Pseudogymnoascus sp. 03VT05]|nr:hypothetical protein VE02_00426 [Pseudogymnoascus sp. 03VT05]